MKTKQNKAAKTLIFVAVSAFCINAFAADPVAAGGVPANSPAPVQLADNQASNSQNAANNQNTAVNPTPVSNPTPANTSVAPAPAPVNPDGTPLVANLDQNGNPNQVDANNPQNADNQNTGNEPVACSTVSIDACGKGNQCQLVTSNTGPNGSLKQQCM